MAFEIDLNRLRDELMEAGKNVGDRLNEATINMRAGIGERVKEESLNKKYAELGKIYYEAHQDTPELVPEGWLFADIKRERDELEALKSEALNKNGAVICPGCGIKASRSAAFCSNCGYALK